MNLAIALSKYESFDYFQRIGKEGVKRAMGRPSEWIAYIILGKRVQVSLIRIADRRPILFNYLSSFRPNYIKVFVLFKFIDFSPMRNSFEFILQIKYAATIGILLDFRAMGGRFNMLIEDRCTSR